MTLPAGRERDPSELINLAGFSGWVFHNSDA